MFKTIFAVTALALSLSANAGTQCFTRHLPALSTDTWSPNGAAGEVGATYDYVWFPDQSGIQWSFAHYIDGVRDAGTTTVNADGTLHDHRTFTGTDYIGIIDFGSLNIYDQNPVQKQATVTMDEDYTQAWKCSGGRGGGCHLVDTTIAQTVCITE